MEVNRAIRERGSTSKLILAIIIVSFSLGGCYKQELAEQKINLEGKEKAHLTEKVEEKGYSDITVQELMQKIELGEKSVLVDVRTSDEYAQGHIKGAILIPLADIETRHKEISKRFT